MGTTEHTLGELPVFLADITGLDSLMCGDVVNVKEDGFGAQEVFIDEDKEGIVTLASRDPIHKGKIYWMKIPRKNIKSTEGRLVYQSDAGECFCSSEGGREYEELNRILEGAGK